MRGEAPHLAELRLERGEDVLDGGIRSGLLRLGQAEVGHVALHIVDRRVTAFLQGLLHTVFVGRLEMRVRHRQLLQPMTSWPNSPVAPGARWSYEVRFHRKSVP